MSRLYLDHASTSWPKAPGVVAAMTDFMQDCGASASRGSYASARRASSLVTRTRERLAQEIHCEDRNCVSFQSGCTAALNAAIHGLLPALGGPGGHVICSAVEHNSVLRPLRDATRHSGAELQIIACGSDGLMSAESIATAIQDRTRLVALTHASNVTGIVQPVAETGRMIAAINATRPATEQIVFLCDAAQTLGYLPIDVSELGVHALAAPAHKGAGGPVGIAMLYLHASLHALISTTIQGGSGHDGLAQEMPTEMPGRLEPGTMNVPAIAGWEAALARPKIDGELLASLARHLHDGLQQIEGVRVLGRRGELPIASLDFGPLMSPAEVAAILDSEFQIEVRSGYHCAAQLHECIGSRDNGTLRVSCGHTTTLADIDRLLAAVREIVAEFNV